MRFDSGRRRVSAAMLALPFAAACRGAAAPPPACVVQRFDGSAFYVCEFDARTQELRLAATDAGGQPLRSFAALRRLLGDDAARVRFAMNAGMFNPAGQPIGLYVENGVEGHRLQLTDGPGNFHMKPNGVFFQDGEGDLHVEPSETYATSARAPVWATQSGPMLVIDGALHPRFMDDGASRLIRNGVGVRDRDTAIFVISEGAVSFGRFARFFRDELACPNALFLDGAVSSLWAPDLNRMDDSRELGPMLVALDREPRT